MGITKHQVAKFSNVNHYPNSLLICICLQPLKIWFFHGSDLLNNKPKLVESKKPYFKEALCYDKEEGINKLQEFLTTYLKNYEEHKLDYYNLQIDTSRFLKIMRIGYTKHIKIYQWFLKEGDSTK